jgi:hypothetical protein
MFDLNWIGKDSVIAPSFFCALIEALMSMVFDLPIPSGYNQCEYGIARKTHWKMN